MVWTLKAGEWNCCLFQNKLDMVYFVLFGLTLGEWQWLYLKPSYTGRLLCPYTSMIFSAGAAERVPGLDQPALTYDWVSISIQMPKERSKLTSQKQIF